MLTSFPLVVAVAISYQAEFGLVDLGGCPEPKSLGIKVAAPRPVNVRKVCNLLMIPRLVLHSVMPPRLRLGSARTLFVQPPPEHSTVASFLLPFLVRSTQQLQHRHASILASLRDAPGSWVNKARLGRGPSSGKGKTSGRGHKGQKARGHVPAGFNGGQTPDEVVHGIRGFKNKYATHIHPHTYRLVMG